MSERYMFANYQVFEDRHFEIDERYLVNRNPSILNIMETLLSCPCWKFDIPPLWRASLFGILYIMICKHDLIQNVTIQHLATTIYFSGLTN